MTADELLATVEDRGIRLVRFLWCGNDGTIRGKASSRHGLAGRLSAGIGLTVAMQAMNSLDQLQPVAGMGPVGEVRLVPDLETFRVVPYAPHTGALLTDHMRPRRHAGPRVPALVPEADGAWAGRAGPRDARRVRERVLARHAGRRGVRAGRLGAVLLDDRDDGVAGLRRRTGRGARSPADPARAVLRRARARSAGDLDRARARAPGRRRAVAGARDDPRRGRAAAGSSPRSPPSRGPRTPATAVTSTSRCGRVTRTASTTRPPPIVSRIPRARSSPECWSTSRACAP